MKTVLIFLLSITFFACSDTPVKKVAHVDTSPVSDTDIVQNDAISEQDHVDTVPTDTDEAVDEMVRDSDHAFTDNETEDVDESEVADNSVEPDDQEMADEIEENEAEGAEEIDDNEVNDIEEGDDNDDQPDNQLIDNDTAVDDENSDDNGPVCGDGIVEGEEVCDLSALACNSDEIAGDFDGGLAQCMEDCSGYDTSTCLRFVRRTLAEDVKGASFSHIDDIDEDGKNDIVVSAFGSSGLLNAFRGSVTIFYNKNNTSLEENNWERESVVTSDDKICALNKTQSTDIDGDGDKDLFVPSGFIFCSVNPFSKVPFGLQWYENSENGWVARDIVPIGGSVLDHELYWHKVLFIDLDGDGIKDVVTTGEIKTTGGTEFATTLWFRGRDVPVEQKENRFEKEPVLIGDGGGSLPLAYDIDADGDMDILSAQYFGYVSDPSSFIWFENGGSPLEGESNWTKHTINSSDAGVSIQLSLIENLYGDGKLHAIGANHTNSTSHPEWPHEAMYSFEVAQDPTDFWQGVMISDIFESEKNPMMGGESGAPGIFDYGDFDGDGDIDLVVSGDGDLNIYWIEQIENGQWQSHILDGADGRSGDDLGQAGVKVGDLDNDGVDDIVVSSYNANAVYLFSLH